MNSWFLKYVFICLCLSNMCIYTCIYVYYTVPGVHWKDWCWSWNSNTLATWCKELTHWKRPWCWERLRVGGEGYHRGGEGWMLSPTQWTWVWVDYESWWWTGRPGMLQFMESQRVRHDWATELNWTDIMNEFWKHYAKWNKPDIKGQILYDSTYTKYLEWSDSQRQKAEWCLPVSGEKGVGSYHLVSSFSLGWWKALEMVSDDGCTTLCRYLIPLNCTFRSS